MRKTKFLLILFMVILTILCNGCQKNEGLSQESKLAAQAWLNALGSDKEYDELTLVEDLQEAYFDYLISVDRNYRHNMEFAAIPMFAYGEQPDWDETSHWLCCFAEYDPETYSWAAADLQAAADKLLKNYTVPLEDSAYLIYDAENERFIATGWDENGSQYYRLNQLTFGGSEYKATFEVYEIDELWADELYVSTSVNGSALVEYALRHGYTEEILFDLDVSAAMREMLFDSEANSLVYRTQIAVRFQLSGDKSLPFTYLEAERTPVY